MLVPQVRYSCSLKWMYIGLKMHQICLSTRMQWNNTYLHTAIEIYSFQFFVGVGESILALTVSIPKGNIDTSVMRWTLPSQFFFNRHSKVLEFIYTVHRSTAVCSVARLGKKKAIIWAKTHPISAQNRPIWQHCPSEISELLKSHIFPSMPGLYIYI